MSSILTNAGAMVALQSLRATQKNLTAAQNAMSTGKKVADARDNSSTWAIGATLQYDADGFQAVIDNLNSAKAAVDLALTGADSIVTTLNAIQKSTIDAQGATPDFTKIGNDVTAALAQISGYVSGASYYGVNLLSAATTTHVADVVSSLSRTGGTAATVSSIALLGQNLSTTAGATSNAVYAITGATLAAATLASATTGGVGALTNASSVSLTATGGATPAASIYFGTAAPTVGTVYSVSLGIGSTTNTFSYTAATGDTVSNLADALRDKIRAVISNSSVAVTTNDSDGTAATVGTLNFVNAGSSAITLSTTSTAAGSGLLSPINSLQVDTAAHALSSYALVTTALSSATAAAANLGTLSNRLQQQSDFVSKMQDSLKTGIGSITDADMEATAARLQALQTQQQLGTQALAIANASPQVLLSLFKNA